MEVTFDAARARFAKPPTPQLREKLYDLLKYKVAGAENTKFGKKFLWKDGKRVYNPSYGAWDLHVRLYNQKEDSFPTGLIPRVKRACPFIITTPLVKKIEPVPHGMQGLRWYQEESIEALIKGTRGIAEVPTGGGKCHGKGTEILMYDGSIKKVEDIVVGDQLMGPDSKPRNVLSLARGQEMLYRITSVKGDAYVVNESHILSLKRSGYARKGRAKVRSGEYSTGDVVNISLRDYLALSKSEQTSTYKQYKVGVEFPSVPVSVDPYFLGLWLGDGNSNSLSITTADAEISAYVYETAAAVSGCSVRVVHQQDNKSSIYHISQGRRGPRFKNDMRQAFERLGVLNNKHVPKAYKSNSREVRLQLLAGLIDSDGYRHRNGHYTFTLKNAQLAEDILFVARSLGYAAYKKEVQKACTYKGEKREGAYHHVSIWGDMEEVPVQLERKKTKDYSSNRNPLVSGIQVEPIGVGDYYGFTLDGDHLYLLGNFVVTHNTFICGALALAYRNGIGLITVPSKYLLHQTYRELLPILGESTLGIYGDGFRSIKKVTVATIQSIAAALRDEPDPEILAWLAAVNWWICDETHGAAAESYETVGELTPRAMIRCGVSATPRREDNKDIVMEGVMGPIRYRIPPMKLVEEGYLAKPSFEWHFWDPGEKVYAVPPGKRKPTYATVYDECFLNDDRYHQYVNQLVQRDVADGYDKAVIIVDKIDHGHRLAEHLTLPHAYIDGKATQKKRDEAIGALVNGDISVLIGSGILDTGVNIPEMMSLTCVGGGQSLVESMQRWGRPLRMDPARKKATMGCRINELFMMETRFLQGHSARRRMEAMDRYPGCSTDIY